MLGLDKLLSGLGDAPRVLLDELKTIRSADVVLQTRVNGQPGPELVVHCVTQPDEGQEVLLNRLGLEIPNQIKRFQSESRTTATVAVGETCGRKHRLVLTVFEGRQGMSHQVNRMNLSRIGFKRRTPAVRRLVALAAAGLAAALFTGPTLSAANLTWDPNQTHTGSDSNGSWDFNFPPGSASRYQG